MLVLMVFIGQAAAAANESCQMSTEKQRSEQSMDAPCMTSIDQSTNIMNDVESCSSQSKTNMAEYCDQECNCPSGDFASAILLTIPESCREVASLQKNSKSPFLVIKQFPTTLYRPPISL